MSDQRPRDDLKTLSQAILDVSAERDLVDLLQVLVDRARELVGARYGALGVPGEDGAGLEHFLVSGLGHDQAQAIGARPTGRGLLGVMLRDGRPVRIPDIAGHPESVGFPSGHPPMRSFLGVPIRRGDELLGNLYLADKVGVATFSVGDQALVEMLARHAALAILNARLLSRLAESENRYRLLTEGAPEVVFSLDAAGRITFINDRVRIVVGSEPERLVGRHLRELVSTQDQSTVDLHMRVLRAGAPRTRFAVAAPGAEGKVHHFEVGLVPSGGAGTAYYGIAQDVTESRALAREVTERTTELLTTREERQRLQEFVSLVMQAQEDERSRIASDLHDTTVQTLTAIGRRLQSLAEDGARDPDAVRIELAELAAAALNEADEVRRLSRNLRPSVLDHLGLAPALQNLVAELRQGGLDVALEVKGEAGRLDNRVRTTLFRIAQEALTNVRRHSEASRVAVWLRVGDDEVSLTVEDDGRGFDVARARSPGTGVHLGLAGMGERTAIMGGTLTIVSGPDAGTRVTARIPLDEPLG